jgi:hypothetical protein
VSLPETGASAVVIGASQAECHRHYRTTSSECGGALALCGSRESRVVCDAHEAHLERENDMLMTLAVILLIAWLLGVVGTYTIGTFVHVLLVIAIVLFLVSIISGRRTVL